MNSSSKRLGEFITQKKKLKVDSNLSNLAFSIPIDVFQSSKSGSSFDELWPQLRDTILTLSQAVVLLGSSFGLSIETSTGDFHDVMMKVGLIQDALGVDKDITDVPFCSCWEGIRFVHQALTKLSALTLHLLNVKSNEQDLIRKLASVGAGVTTLERRFQGMEVLISTIESDYISHFSCLNKLYLFCSCGAGKQTGESVATHIRNIVDILQRLESTSSSFASSIGYTAVVRPVSFGFNPLHIPCTLIDTKLAPFSAGLSLVRSSILELTTKIGQDAVDIGDVHFQFLAHTAAWVKNKLSNFFFKGVITLLDMIGTSNFSDGDFLDSQYKASRANFVNDSAARCVASFEQKFPTLFGRVEPSSNGGQLFASTHPVHLIHDYKRFNVPDNLSGVK